MTTGSEAFNLQALEEVCLSDVRQPGLWMGVTTELADLKAEEAWRTAIYNSVIRSARNLMFNFVGVEQVTRPVNGRKLDDFAPGVGMIGARKFEKDTKSNPVELPSGNYMRLIERETKVYKRPSFLDAMARSPMRPLRAGGFIELVETKDAAGEEYVDSCGMQLKAHISPYDDRTLAAVDRFSVALETVADACGYDLVRDDKLLRLGVSETLMSHTSHMLVEVLERIVARG